MSNWTYKEFNVELVGANFVTVIAGKRVASPSLKAAQKAIDKHLENQAKAVDLSLPVVMLRSAGRFSRQDGNSGEIVHGAITGLDPESLTVQGLEGSNEYILPDVKGNDDRLVRFVAAEREYYKLRDEVKAKVVPTWFFSHGRAKLSYADVVKKLLDGYAKALKDESDE